MIELFCIVAIVLAALASAAAWLFSLSAGETLMIATAMVPVLAVLHYGMETRHPLLKFMRRHRDPNASEQSHWLSIREQLRHKLLMAAIAMPFTWIVSLAIPASFNADPLSLLGWLLAAGAIMTTAYVISSAWLYFSAAHRADHYTPAFVGTTRKWMYEISHNPDFL